MTAAHVGVGDPGPPRVIPARIVNEHAYCPRLAYLMWVDGANADNAATIEGKHVHRRVDQPSGNLAPEQRPQTVRSVDLGDEELGVVARIDLVDVDGQQAIPVEFKRGAPWTANAPLRRPEQLQLYAQVCLLRRHGYDVPHAAVWFNQTRQRVRIASPTTPTIRSEAPSPRSRRTQQPPRHRPDWSTTPNARTASLSACAFRTNMRASPIRMQPTRG